MNIVHPTVALFSCAMFVLPTQARATCQERCLANDNTVLGEDALGGRSAGNGNTAIGFNALFRNVNGVENTAVGGASIFGNSDGNHNVALGNYSLEYGYGSDNTALGYDVMLFNSGNENTGVGDSALRINDGSSNVAVGANTLPGSVTGNSNVAFGNVSLVYLTDGSNNIALGYGIESIIDSDNITIGNPGTGADSGTIRIGGDPGTYVAAYIAGISGAPLTHGAAIAVGITADGQLGVRASSARFKEAIKPMGQTSEAIFALKPVTFRYKKELDPKGTPQFGLVAEEVAKVNPDLVVTDNQGKPFTVRYEAVNAMLLNEFLKEHENVKKLRSVVGKHQKQIEALTAGLQKVSTQLELSKPGTQTVQNNR